MNAIPADPRTWLSTRLVELCSAETTSGQEDAGLPGLRALLQELGATVVEQPVAPGRTNLLALWGRPRVLFSTHLDTVPPYLPPRLQDGAVWGRGACDAKGQILAQLGAVKGLLAEGRDGFAWLGVVGEETDSAGGSGGPGPGGPPPGPARADQWRAHGAEAGHGPARRHAPLPALQRPGRPQR